MDLVCQHLDQINSQVQPDHPGVCQECVDSGDHWVHLRMCLICGHIGCCDSSKNQHARKHYESTGHPIVQSAQPGEDWRWCYSDNIYL